MMPWLTLPCRCSRCNRLHIAAQANYQGKTTLIIPRNCFACGRRFGASTN